MMCKLYLAVLVIAVVAVRLGHCGSLRKVADVNHDIEATLKRESDILGMVARQEEECASAPNAIVKGFPCCTGFTTREQCNEHGSTCAFLTTGCVFQCANIKVNEECAAVTGCSWILGMICVKK